ncbi:hypothetical protein [Suttonella indologenes]|uniref:DUF1640 domain-containing protein n=1 Tax=Suttonella indologenes TaxID=13276 RepID=A0A380MKB1_9GAMM|nr:hypothetical protein [Suttonella indologenes]SUO90267.1 Uncharacterised protein [Suttonella indologenes]
MTQLSTIVALVGKLPEEQREAISGLIDLKTEGDMQKVLDRLDLMEQKFETRFDAMDQKFEAKFDALNNKINITQWFIGGMIALLAIVSRIV